MFAIRMARSGIAAALVAVALSACSDSTEPSDEPEFTTIRLVVGAQTVNITRANCAVSGGPIQIGAGTTTLTAQYLLENGTADPVVNNADFRLDVTVANTGLATYAGTGAFGGAFTRVAAGATSVTVALFHLGEQHNEVSCPAVPLTVQ